MKAKIGETVTASITRGTATKKIIVKSKFVADEASGIGEVAISETIDGQQCILELVDYKYAVDDGGWAPEANAEIEQIKQKILHEAIEYYKMEQAAGNVGPETMGLIAEHYGVKEEDLKEALKE